jgi:hypothetical protein
MNIANFVFDVRETFVDAIQPNFTLRKPHVHCVKAFVYAFKFIQYNTAKPLQITYGHTGWIIPQNLRCTEPAGIEGLVLESHPSMHGLNQVNGGRNTKLLRGL